ncbi:MAG: hypothetical protein R6X20_02360 [Phycisphaerae bacterium]
MQRTHKDRDPGHWLVVAMTVLALGAVLLAAAGCAVPQAALEGIIQQKAWIEADAATILRLLAARDETLAARQTQIREAADADVKAYLDAGGEPAEGQTLGDWVLETYAVAQAETDRLQERRDALDAIRQTVLANKRDRKAALERLAQVIVASQQWNAETQALVMDLLDRAEEASHGD